MICIFSSKLVAQRQEKKDIVTARPRNEDVTTMTVHKNLKEKEKWVAIVRKRQPLNHLAKKLRLKLPNGPNLSVNIQVDNYNYDIRNTLYLQFTFSI